MDKILILGISGFSGYHLEKYISSNKLSKDFLFFGADIKNPSFKIDFDFFKVDLTNTEDISKIILLINPDYIINLTGLFKSSNFSELYKINADISRKIMEIILNNQISIKKILFIGSAAEYGAPQYLPIDEYHQNKPLNYYGLSKLLQTDIINYFKHNSKIPLNLARTFNIIGKNISKNLSIGAFVEKIKNAKNDETIKVGNLSTKRDFLDIKDIIDAYWKILLYGKPGEIYNVCSGKSIAIGSILQNLIEFSKKDLLIKINPEWIIADDIKDIYGDNSKLKKIGWQQTITINESISHIF